MYLPLERRDASVTQRVTYLYHYLLELDVRNKVLTGNSFRNTEARAGRSAIFVRRDACGGSK